jgi:predicted permease
MDGIDLSPDLTVLGFTMAAASATTLLFGLAPALRATALEPFLALRETTGAGGRHALGLARFLVVAQVALSLVLLSGASLFVRSLQNLRGVELGFDQSRLLLFGINANQAGLKGAELAQLYERIQAAIGRLPGVQSATMTPYRLLSSSSSNYSVSVPGYVPAPGERASARVLLVGESFFATLGIPILMGRELDGRDAESAPLVAVANQAFIGKYLGGRSAVGQTFSFGRDSDKPVEIVGIARNARYDRLRGDFAPTLYVPIRQSLPNLSGLYFEVKTTRDPLSVVPDVRKSVAAIHPGIPLFGIRTQAEQIEELLRPERLFALLTSFFGVLALALVCVGLYGIISYGVAMRTTEIGVRMALGARPPDIVRMVLRETGGLVARGVALGLPAAFAGGYFASSVVSSILFGIPSTDTLSLLAATLLMALVGSFAGVPPARRASAVAPMSALRCE